MSEWDMDEYGLPLVKTGDVVRIADGLIGTVTQVSSDRFQIKLTESGKVVTEPRNRFDVIPSCSGREAGSENAGVSLDQVETDHDSLDDFDINGFIEGEQNKNTLRKTQHDLNRFCTYLETLKEKRPIETIPPAQLSKLICVYVINVKTAKGDDYEPSTIRGMVSSIDRYLKSKGYVLQIVSSPEFAKVMQVVKCKQRKLKRGGKGNLQNRADALTDTDIDKLYTCKQLGNDNPEILIRTVWFQNSVYFGMRGVTEHHHMRWGDVIICTDPEGNEYLEFTERQTKTRPGCNLKNVRALPPRAWATPNNPSRCPVAMLKDYQSRRPPTYCAPDDPYYIATNTNRNKSFTWFKCQPVGVNKLGAFMKTMAQNAGLTSKDSTVTDGTQQKNKGKRLTNHSARKYLVQKLNDHGLPPNQIMQVSRRKNITSINNYSTINSNQQKAISRVLSEKAPSSAVATAKPSHVSAIGMSTSNVTQRYSSFTSSVPLFGGPIYGGTFHVNIHNGSSVKRPRVIYSDSDSQ